MRLSDMQLYSLEDIIKDAKKNYNISVNPHKIHLKAANKIIDTINNGNINITIGPPGSGKTTTIALTLSNIYDELDEAEVVIYATTHNKLVLEASKKTIGRLIDKVGSDEIKKTVLVSGSHFVPMEPSENTKLIFTTFHQPTIVEKVLSMKDRVHVITDEASTAKNSQTFLPTSYALNDIFLGGNIDLRLISSLSLIGDPMQALLISRYRVKPMIFEIINGMIKSPQDKKRIEEEPDAIFEIIEQYLPKSDFSYSFLEKTFRLPSPTETLISIPFYRSKLTAFRSIKDVKINTIGGSLKWLINKTKLLGNIRDVLDYALDSKIPVVYLKDLNLTPYRDDNLRTYDDKRATYAAEITAYLSKATTGENIMIIVPYREMVAQILPKLNKIGVDKRRVEVSTAHSALGTDADIVIAVLGKEYKVIGIGDTIYYNIPQALNVQLSRHKKMLIVIGNLDVVAKTASKLKGYKFLAKVQYAIERLKEVGSIVIKEV